MNRVTMTFYDLDGHHPPLVTVILDDAVAIKMAAASYAHMHHMDYERVAFHHPNFVGYQIESR